MGKLSHIVKAIDRNKQQKLLKDVKNSEDIMNKIESLNPSVADEYEIIRNLSKYAEKLGFRTKTSGSNQSSSSYLEPSYNDRDLDFDDEGNELYNKDADLGIKIRASNHDLPSKYDAPTFDINTSGSTRQESHTDDWRDALAYLVKKRNEVGGAYLDEDLDNFMKGRATPAQMTGAGAVGASGMGLQAFLAKRKQRANSLVNRIGYVAEPLATIATGYGADVLGGLAGAVTAPFVGAEQAAKNVETVQSALPAYMPKTEGGNQAFEDLGGLIDKGAHMYNFTADKTGFDPMANFEQSAEWLHQHGYDVPASLLKGAPELL